MGELSDFERGYCMGLVAGEGCFTHTHSLRFTYPVITVGVSENDPEMLAYLQRCLGGRIYGPYKHGKIFWNLTGRAIVPVLPLLLSQLPPGAKRRQFELWHARFKPFFDGGMGI